jgi:hypothetical protein
LKIAFFTKSYNYIGGKEKVLRNISKNLSLKYNIEIITYDDDYLVKNDDYSLTKLRKVNIFSFEKNEITLIKIYKYIKDIYKLIIFFKNYKYDYIISTEQRITNILYFINLLKISNCKIYSWEHLTYLQQKNRIKIFLRKYIYGKIYGIITINPTEFKFYHSINNNCFLISNPLITEYYENNFVKKNELLFIGDCFNKGLIYIPQIAKYLNSFHKDWKIKIIGEGIEIEDLKEIILKDNLMNQIIFKNKSNSIKDEYISSTILLNLSFYECYPGVLMEAMFYKCFCISFNSPTGPSHIVNNYKNGILIDHYNIDELCRNISYYIYNIQERNLCVDHAFDTICKVDNNEIYKKWAKILL